MDWVRIFTGFVITLITLTCLAIGGLFLSISVAVVAVVALYEFYQVVCKQPNFFLFFFGYLDAVALVLISNLYGTIHLPLVLSLDVLLVSILSVIMFKNNSDNTKSVMQQISGLMYIATPLSFLIIIRNGDYGFLWSLMILSVIASGDIGAYYLGRLFGRHQLCLLSPKKTLEGSLSGLLCSIIVVFVFKFYLLDFMSISFCFLFACFVSVAGQIGDLFASGFKRAAGVKDFGNFLPGHGGLLDRIDSMLLALPIAYVFYLQTI